MNFRQWRVCVVFLLGLSAATVAATPLLKTTTAWNGDHIDYPTGDAEITAFILELKAGKPTPLHCHPVPTMGYLLKGEIEVETDVGAKRRFREGEAVVEVFRTLHRGRALTETAQILVFYAGAVDQPNTILASDATASEECPTSATATSQKP